MGHFMLRIGRRTSPARARAEEAGPFPARLERRARPRPRLHFRRLELKYFLPERFVQRYLDCVAPFTDVDPYLIQLGKGQTSYPVTSLYFDSYDLTSLFEKENGILFRRKMRLR